MVVRGSSYTGVPEVAVVIVLVVDVWETTCCGVGGSSP